jgi:ActR/RegA family two-component response regulator
MARVLVVDDDVGTLDTVGGLLGLAALEVRTAASGQRALAVLRSEPCDLPLTDLKLPDISGLDVVATLRQRGSTLPVVIMTGYASVETAVEAMKLGAVDYLVKPVFEDTLLDAVDRALGGSQVVRGGEPPTVGTATASASHRAEPVRVAETAGAAASPGGLTHWVEAVSQVIQAPDDPKRLRDWAKIAAAAPGTLRGWCRTVGLPAKSSLDLARVLRAVSWAHRHGCPPSHFLDVGDPRTLKRLLGVAGVGDSPPLPTLDDVLVGQTLIGDPLAIETLRARLVAEGAGRASGPAAPEP